MDSTKKEQISNALQQAKNVKVSISDAVSYKQFVNYFKEGEITNEKLIIGINFAYGWMPRMLTLCPGLSKNGTDESKNRIKEIEKQIEGLVGTCNKVKEGKEISVEELQKLKGCFNNSIVGVSKLLHFINPDIYPIWDSRVHAYFKENIKEEKLLKLDSVESYLYYKQLCCYYINNASVEELTNTFKNKLGYEVTALRAMDLVFYHLDKGKQKSPSITEQGL